MATTRSERRSAKLHMCRLDIPEDAHGGGGGGGGGGHYNESNYPVEELGRKRGGGCNFEGGVLAGHYGMPSAYILLT